MELCSTRKKNFILYDNMEIFGGFHIKGSNPDIKKRKKSSTYSLCKEMIKE